MDSFGEETVDSACCQLGSQNGAKNDVGEGVGLALIGRMEKKKRGCRRCLA